jgi:hypothetical protein
MLDSGSHEQEVARPERIPLAVVQEHPATANDKVDLILGMRRLLPCLPRDGKSYIQRTAPEDDNGVLACGARDTCPSLGKANNLTTMWAVHAAPRVASKLRRCRNLLFPARLRMVVMPLKTSLQIMIEPGKHTFHHVALMVRLVEDVALTGIDHQLGVYAKRFQGVPELP